MLSTKKNNIFWALLAVKRQIATFAYCLNWSSKLVKIGSTQLPHHKRTEREEKFVSAEKSVVPRE